MRKQLISVAVVLFGLLAVATRANAHAFLVRAQPRVGSKVKKPPTEVRIWFSEPIQLALSSIKVFDETGKEVSKKNTRSDPAKGVLLDVPLAPDLKPRTYRVIWRVTSVDTHVTSGDFKFQVVGTQRAGASSRPK